MALIFAIQDEAGGWHGEPDAETTYMAPEGVLSFFPRPGEPGADRPLAGQRLRVLVAGLKGSEGEIQYRLDDGRLYWGTYFVDEILFGDEHRSVRSWPPPEALHQ